MDTEYQETRLDHIIRLLRQCRGESLEVDCEHTRKAFFYLQDAVEHLVYYEREREKPRWIEGMKDAESLESDADYITLPSPQTKQE